MNAPSKPEYIPLIKTPRDVAVTAIRAVKEEASGVQLGLKTRFPGLNIAIGKYFRFKQVYSISGLSGHGKSILLNMLIQDFLNPSLNLDACVYDYIVCHHAFEMNPEDEELRKASTKLQVSYNHLLSSEIDPTTGRYNKLTDAELVQLEEVLKEDVDKPIYYFDEPCELKHIALNVRSAINRYKTDTLSNEARLERYCKKKGKKITDIIDPDNPPTLDSIDNPKVVITIDHTLLLKQAEHEKDILHTMRNLAKTAIALKKKGYLVIFVGQFNNNIEKLERIRNVEVQYPVKSDIYAQGEIYNACDGVFTIHRAELLGILRYGKNRLKTDKLVHLQVLKMRFGKVGSIWFRNRLDIGLFEQLDFKTLKQEAEFDNSDSN